MKRFHLWMLAAALIICGMTTMFTSCSNNDDKSATDNGLAEKVTGKWMLVDSDGQPAVTDRVSVYTFTKEGSVLKACFSLAMAESQTWLFNQQADVTVGTVIYTK